MGISLSLAPSETDSAHSTLAVVPIQWLCGGLLFEWIEFFPSEFDNHEPCR